MFTQVRHHFHGRLSVILVTGEGGVRGGGYAWWRGVCMAGEACVAGTGVHGGGHVWRGACVAGEMATAAGGTHPTGVHSCFNYVLITL